MTEKACDADDAAPANGQSIRVHCSSLWAGLSRRREADVLLPTPSESWFNAAQDDLIVRLVAFARCTRPGPAQPAKKIAVMTFDGSWSHIRWSGQCFGLFIDLNQRRIVDFEFVPPRKCGGEFDCSGQGDSSRRMAERRKASRTHLPIWFTTMSRTIDELQCEIVAFFNRNHVMLDLTAAFRKWSGSSRTRRGDGRTFSAHG
jgi:hypothetical protein